MHLEPPRRSGRDRAEARDPASRDEERAPEARLERRREHAHAQRTHPLELGDSLDGVLEGRQPVAHPRSVLEAKVARETSQLRAQRGDRRRGVLTVEALERAGTSPPPVPAGQRAERPRSRDRRPPLAATLEVDVALGVRGASVGRRAQLADEAQLLERGLELRAEASPLDALERLERSLDGGTLAVPEKYERSRGRRSRALPT